MKTFITISAILLASCFNAQSHFKAKKLNKREKELFNIAKKSYYYKNKNISLFEFDIEEIIKFYACLEKYYKLNPLEEYELKTEEQLKNETGEEYKNPIYYQSHSYHFFSFGQMNHELRVRNQKGAKKCIKKSDIDY